MQETMKRKKESSIICETFRLNKNMEKEAELIAMLEDSNNKSGLIKDALGMYKAMVNRGLYNSPFLVKAEADWDNIIAQLDPSRMITGRPANAVKEQLKQELRAEAEEEYYEEDEDFGNDDNDLDF